MEPQLVPTHMIVYTKQRVQCAARQPLLSYNRRARRNNCASVFVLLGLLDEIDGRLVNNACGFHRLLQVGGGTKRLCLFKVLVVH